MNRYAYNGPVMSFGRVIAVYNAETIAPSAEKAKANIAYRFKKECGAMPNAKFTLPGKIELIERDIVDD